MPQQHVETKIEKPLNVLALLPDDEINWLQSLGQRWKDEYWHIGDVINQAIDVVMHDDLPIPIMSIYTTFVELTGGEKTERTMRYLAQVAKHFPANENLRYAYDEVPHYFFGIIMRYPGWEQILLELCQQEIERRGKSPGEAWLYNMISSVVHAPTIDNTPPELPQPDPTLLYNQPLVHNWQDLPKVTVKPQVNSYLLSLHDLVARLPNWDIPKKRLKKIQRLIDELRSELYNLDA